MSEYVIKDESRYLTLNLRWTDRISLARHWSDREEADAYARRMLDGLEGHIKPLPKLDVVPVRKKRRVDAPEAARAAQREVDRLNGILQPIASEVGLPATDHDAILGAIQRRSGAAGELYAINVALCAAGVTTSAILGHQGNRLVSTLERVEWLIRDRENGGLPPLRAEKAALLVELQTIDSALADMRLRIAQLTKS